MNNFTVSIPVKSYIKQFLVTNCGNPVDLSNLPDLLLILRRCLKKPINTWNSCYKNEFKKHSETIDIIISENDFYRYGWELSKTDIIAFGKEVEIKVKCAMRTTVGIYIGLGLPINTSIYKFQQQFNFNEDTWAYESIKKDFYRNGQKEIISFEDEIFKKIEKLIIFNLSDKGTISTKFLNEYEYNS